MRNRRAEVSKVTWKLTAFGPGWRGGEPVWWGHNLIDACIGCTSDRRFGGRGSWCVPTVTNPCSSALCLSSLSSTPELAKGPAGISKDPERLTRAEVLLCTTLYLSQEVILCAVILRDSIPEGCPVPGHPSGRTDTEDIPRRLGAVRLAVSKGIDSLFRQPQ